MSEYIQKFQQLDDEARQEVLDFVDFLLDKKGRKRPVDSASHKDGRPQVSVWSEEDVKAIREARNHFNQPQRTFNTMPDLVIQIADDFDAPLEDFKEYM
jgi:hypothetical protein